MLSYQINSLVATLILSLLLSSTKVFSKTETFSEWIFQIRSESGFLLSQGLVSLKIDKTGSNYFFAACDFFLMSGAIANLTEDGCILTSLDDKKIYIKNKRIFVENEERFKPIYLNGTAYISEEDFKKLGYEIFVDQSEMVVQISHRAGLPIDKKNKLLKESVNEEMGSIKVKKSRAFFSFNRIQAELYKSPSRNGSLAEGDFDFLSGELILKECDEICLNFYQWTKKARIKGVDLNLSIGNNDLFYFPGKWQRLNNAIVVDLNKKTRKQKFSLDYGATTDYFIYRNGILIRRGKGSIKDIEFDLGEENYFSQYTVKVVDVNGRIQTFDLYNGLGMLHPGDYSLSSGSDNKSFTFGTAQIGITRNLNFSAGTFNTPESKYMTKRVSSSFKHLRFEYGELTNESNIQENQFEQTEISFSNIAYIYNHRNDKKTERDNIQHTILLTPKDLILQFQHRLTDKENAENEYLIGRRIHDYFLYGSFLKDALNQETKSIKLSSANELLNYDVGISKTLETINYFALLSGTKDNISMTTNFDIRPNQKTVGSRIDYRFKNKNAYATMKHMSGSTEIGLGITFNFFPSNYNIELMSQSQTIIKTTLFLDKNENGKKDLEEYFLEGIGGSINSTNNYKRSNKDGSMYFEVDNNYNSVIFSTDESTFKEMYLLPPKENLKFEVWPRKVNQFDIPIKINGVALIECSNKHAVRNLEIAHGEKIILSKSICIGPTFIDQMKPGKYRLSYNQKGRKKTKHFELVDKTKYFFSVEL